MALICSIINYFVAMRQKESFIASIRQLDAFGRPVTLYHRGDTKYRTTCGACTTIFLVVILFLSFLGDVHMAHCLPDYFAMPPERMTLSKPVTLGKHAMVAFMIIPDGKALDNKVIDSHLRVTFNQGNIRVPAVYCKDLLSNEIEIGQESDLYVGFVSKEDNYLGSMLDKTTKDSHNWLCPDTSINVEEPL